MSITPTGVFQTNPFAKEDDYYWAWIDEAGHHQFVSAQQQDVISHAIWLHGQFGLVGESYDATLKGILRQRKDSIWLLDNCVVGEFAPIEVWNREADHILVAAREALGTDQVFWDERTLAEFNQAWHEQH